MRPTWGVSLDFFDTMVAIRREVGRPGGDGSTIYRDETVGRLMAQVEEPRLLQTSDQQGRPGVDLARTVYFQPGANVRPGDRLETSDLRLRVESAADRAGMYRKCLTVEEHGS